MITLRLVTRANGVAVASFAVMLVACDREERRFTDRVPTPPAYATVSLDTLQPGVPSPDADIANRSERNAYDISEGKRLFSQWNCTGCHSHGGGGMGPALMDDEWIYGSDAENIVATIVEGRPNGMPSFRNKIPPQQLWQLAAYVRSLSGLPSKDAVSSRSEGMSAGTPQSLTPHPETTNSDPAPQQ